MSDDNEIDALIKLLPPEARKRMERLRKAQREKGRLFHQQLTIVYGTIGAICFAGLVLVIQDPGPFRQNGFKFLTPHQNFDLFVLVLSIAIILALLSCLPTSLAAAGFVQMLDPVGTVGYVSGLLAIASLVLSVLLMVGDVSPVGGDILAVAIVVILVVMGLALASKLGWLSVFR